MNLNQKFRFLNVPKMPTLIALIDYFRYFHLEQRMDIAKI